MVLGAARAPADAPTPELDRLAIDLGRDRLLSRVVVNGLATSDVGELLRAGGRDTGLAGELHAATGGNAFFLTELIRHGNGSPLGGELPESIRAMVGVRLDRLDRTVTHVLNLTAIAGPAATLPVLERASGLDGDRLLDAVDTALAAGLLVEDGAGRLAMPHALIGQAVVSRLGRTRRLDLHRRIADALEQAGEPQSSPGTLAHHLIEAGSLADRSQRVSAALAAGRHALDVAAYEDATRWCERVDALVTDRTDPAQRTEAAVLRSDTARARGDREVALAAAREAADLARTTDDPMLLAQAAERWMLALSAIGFDIGEPADPELVALLEQVIATLPDDERQYQVRMRSMLASVLVASSDGSQREALAAEALAIAQADGRPELVASAQLARRLALWQLDRLDERTEAVLVAVAEARRAGNVHLELTAALFAMSDLLEQARVDDHLRLLAEFRARATALHMPLYLTYALFIESGHRLAAGEYAEAERLADEALAVGRASHGVNAEIVYGGIQYLLAQDRGRLASTLPVIEQMAAAHPRLQMWKVAMLGALLDAGRSEEARTDLRGLRRHEVAQAPRQPDLPSRRVRARPGLRPAGRCASRRRAAPHPRALRRTARRERHRRDLGRPGEPVRRARRPRRRRPRRRRAIAHRGDRPERPPRDAGPRGPRPRRPGDAAGRARTAGGRDASRRGTTDGSGARRRTGPGARLAPSGVTGVTRRRGIL